MFEKYRHAFAATELSAFPTVTASNMPQFWARLLKKVLWNVRHSRYLYVLEIYICMYVAALDVITVRVWVELDTAQGQHKWDSRGVFLDIYSDQGRHK